MRQNLFIQSVAIMTVALMLLLAGVVRLCALNLGRLIDTLGRNVQMTVYLSDGVSPQRAKQIADALRRLPGVQQVHSVDEREAYDRLRRALGDHGDLLDGVEEGLLPRSIEVTFRSGVSDVLRVHPLYTRLRATEGVEDVELMSDWVRRLLQAQQLVRTVGWTLGLLLGLSCIYLVGATIRLGIHARRDEIEVLKLVGATNLYIEAPFLLEGLVQGLLGAALATLGLLGLYRLGLPWAQGTLRDLLGDVPLGFLPAGEVVAAIAGAGLLGLVGSGLAVSRHVRL
ncbi:MAG: permease-like cell division protein FtsX [Myxococcales bacterium]|nr:permease-like cell division protein FtsX [Myxococcota bacterium]MDW8283510.1 permease-like cell division protein FtsX [Myxococcales bacterium]